MAQPLWNSQSDALKELRIEIQSLDKFHLTTRKSRQIARRLQPFVDFIERYSPAVDVGIQGTVSPATLIWGCLRAIIIVLVFRRPRTNIRF